MRTPLFPATAVRPFAGMATQDYAAYTDTDHRVWQVLYERMQLLLPGRAASRFLSCLDEVGFRHDRIPDFEETSALLAQKTGWRIQAVEGLIDDAPFFELLKNRVFPAGYWIRTPEQLDYLEEPDLFHDIFGHVPLLAEPAFADFLEGLGHAAAPYSQDPIMIELLARLYWFTVEFGLIQEPAGLRIYGAGILSSTGETSYSLGEAPRRYPFDVLDVLKTAFRKDTFQDLYFVVDAYEQLFESLPAVSELLARTAATAKALGPVPPTETATAATRCVVACCG